VPNKTNKTMGQYLAISIINEHTVSKKNLEKYQITAQEVSLRARFDESIYEFSEHEQYYTWTIRKEILETHLIAFLEDFYPKYYFSDSEYKEVLEKLRGKSADFMLEKADGKYYESFQIDKYGMSDYLYFHDKPFKPEVVLNFTGIMIALEGKVFMESYTRMLNLFTQSLQLRFPNNPLGKTLKVYITG